MKYIWEAFIDDIKDGKVWSVPDAPEQTKAIVSLEHLTQTELVRLFWYYLDNQKTQGEKETRQ